MADDESVKDTVMTPSNATTPTLLAGLAVRAGLSLALAPFAWMIQTLKNGAKWLHRSLLKGLVSSCRYYHLNANHIEPLLNLRFRSGSNRRPS